MINLFGFLLIIAGFIIPFLTDGQIRSTFFFLVGFLLLLWPNRYFPKMSFWLKWGRIGVILKIFGTLFLILFFRLITQTSFSSSYFALLILQITSYIFSPFARIFDIILPKGQITMPDGSAQYTISFIRASVTSFCDILAYILIGIAIGKLIAMKQSKKTT
jgi:hypothetical protein